MKQDLKLHFENYQMSIFDIIEDTSSTRSELNEPVTLKPKS